MFHKRSSTIHFGVTQAYPQPFHFREVTNPIISGRIRTSQFAMVTWGWIWGNCQRWTRGHHICFVWRAMRRGLLRFRLRCRRRRRNTSIWAEGSLPRRWLLIFFNCGVGYDFEVFMFNLSLEKEFGVYFSLRKILFFTFFFFFCADFLDTIM